MGKKEGHGGPGPHGGGWGADPLIRPRICGPPAGRRGETRGVAPWERLGHKGLRFNSLRLLGVLLVGFPSLTALL